MNTICMRYYNIFVFVGFALVCTSCDEYGLSSLGIGILYALFCLVVLIFGVYFIGNRQYQKHREELIQQEEKLTANRQALDNLKQTYDAKRAELAKEFGEPDKTIVIYQYLVDKEIRAYSKLRKITILGKTFDFDSILSCNVTDDAQIERGQTTITSTGMGKTDTGSMLGRAVVGGLVAGGVGAVVGGATAKTKTTSTSVVQHSNDYTRHNYTIWVSVKDIVNPLIQIAIGNDSSKTNEIVALINAVIASK